MSSQRPPVDMTPVVQNIFSLADGKNQQKLNPAGKS